MGIRSFLATCAVILFACLPVFSAAAKGVPSADLTDPAGDIRDKTGKDIVKVSLSSDGKNVKATVTLKDDLMHSITDAMAPGTILELYFDTDAKETTGGKGFWGAKGGFEFECELNGCIDYEGGASACAGGAGSKIKSLFSVTETKKFTKAGTSDTDDLDHFWDLAKVPVQGKQIEATVPYEKIGVKSGQTIRVALREADSSMDDKSFFPDTMLILK